MAKMKLKVAKLGRMNPHTKTMGYSARVITSGTADFEDIVTKACHNTTMNKAEAKLAMELCIDMVAEMLMQGYIVDLGPIGKLYPSCSSGWTARAEDLRLDKIVTSICYRPSGKVAAAVKEATLQWASEEEEE